MRVSKIRIEGLFGMFNHEIPLNTNERITILHGPNGVGKTTILKLISDLFAKRFHSLGRTPYKRLKLEFLPPYKPLEVYREIDADSGPRPSPNIRFVTKVGKKEHEYKSPGPKEIRKYTRRLPLSAIDDLIPTLQRIGQELWEDEPSGDVLDLEDVWFRYGDRLPFDLSMDLKEFPEWLDQLLGSLTTHFIQTQRLFAIPPSDAPDYRRRKPNTMSTVEKYSEDMSEKIQQTLRQSGVLAASLDRTFPHRLLGSSTPEDATEMKIRDDYEAQATYRSRLMKAGLIDAEEPIALPTAGLDVNERKVLWHYLRDVEQKFEVFSGLLGRIELFKDIINKRFQYKSFSVDKNSGFLFSTHDDKFIPLHALSSGEQHELVLAYELIFMVKSDSLILIDEPELSLHVTWQHRFLSDIERISDLVNLDFLVATHSPSIIHDRSDLMIPLEEG